MNICKTMTLLVLQIGNVERNDCVPFVTKEEVKLS